MFTLFAQLAEKILVKDFLGAEPSEASSLRGDREPRQFRFIKDIYYLIVRSNLKPAGRRLKEN